MKGSSGFRSGLETGVLLGLGFFCLVALGIGLLVLGFVLGRRAGELAAAYPTATMPADVSPQPTATIAVIPTATEMPLPTATPAPPTPIPLTETPLQPVVVAGTRGANIRSGPGTNFPRIGYVEPGTQLPVIGRYANWWQVLYNGAPAWVAGSVVTASNTEGVPVVVPPPSPTPLPPTAIPTATPIPATPTPASVRGLTVRSFVVSNRPRREWSTAVIAPGPFGVNTPIWCYWEITNGATQPFVYTILGCWVQETGFHKKSYSSWPKAIMPGQQCGDTGLCWEDWLSIGSPGRYHLYLRICFDDGFCGNLAGPVIVNVQ